MGRKAANSQSRDPSSHLFISFLCQHSQTQGAVGKGVHVDRVGIAPLIAGKGWSRAQKSYRECWWGSAAQKHPPRHGSDAGCWLFVSMLNLWPGNLALLRFRDKGWCFTDSEWDSHNIIKYINITNIYKWISNNTEPYRAMWWGNVSSPTCSNARFHIQNKDLMIHS